MSELEKLEQRIIGYRSFPNGGPVLRLCGPADAWLSDGVKLLHRFRSWRHGRAFMLACGCSFNAKDNTWAA